MKKQTIASLWKMARTNAEPLIGIPSNTQAYDFMDEYNSSYTRYDRIFAKTKGFFEPLWNSQYEDDPEDILDEFQLDCDALIQKNADKYQRIWDALKAEYDPIENYDRTEEWSDTDDGSDTVTDNFAQQQRTNNYGAEHESVSVGQQVNTNAQGARQQTQQHGATHEETINGVAGFNASVASPYSPDNESIRNTNQYSDTLSDAAVTDTLTQGSHTDTSDKNAHSDTLTDAAHSDTHETEYGKSTTHEGRVHGNVGVTTNQQMITSEIEMRQKYNFYDILFAGIIKELCRYHYPGHRVMSPIQ